METFLLAFLAFLVIVAGMAIGAIVSGRTIKGSCGGLNAVAGADRCLVCSRPVDPDSPLHERMQCPRARRMAAGMRSDATEGADRA